MAMMMDKSSHVILQWMLTSMRYKKRTILVTLIGTAAFAGLLKYLDRASSLHAQSRTSTTATTITTTTAAAAAAAAALKEEHANRKRAAASRRVGVNAKFLAQLRKIMPIVIPGARISHE